MKNPHTLNVLLISALATLFNLIRGSNSLHPVLTGPNLGYLGSRVAFRCAANDSSSSVTYELMKDGDYPILTDTVVKGDDPEPFFLKINAESEGSYHCKATAGGSTSISNIISLGVVIPASNTRVTSEPFPPIAYEGFDIILSCDVAKGSHLSYNWYFNKKAVKNSTLSFFHVTGNKLVIEKVTPEHAGYYSCMAWSRVQDAERFSSSPEVHMTVKVCVSKPRISFSISKEGNSYHSNVTCWSARGSLPVNFSLSLVDKKVGSVTATESLTAWFAVPIVPGLDMGVARCRVKTEVQDMMSEPVTLLFVPVEGHLTMEVEYLYKADSKLAAAQLSCHVSRGTFPYVSWVFNDTVLPSESLGGSHLQPVLSHYATDDNSQMLFLAQLGPEESGYYRCRARDSYDDSGPWVESAAVLVQAKEVLLTTIEIIAITFCCLLLLALAVGACCVYKMFDHQQAYVNSTTSNARSDALPMSEPTSRSGGPPADTYCTDSDIQNQVIGRLFPKMFSEENYP